MTSIECCCDSFCVITIEANVNVAISTEIEAKKNPFQNWMAFFARNCTVGRKKKSCVVDGWWSKFDQIILMCILERSLTCCIPKIFEISHARQFTLCHGLVVLIKCVMNKMYVEWWFIDYLLNLPDSRKIMHVKNSVIFFFQTMINRAHCIKLKLFQLYSSNTSILCVCVYTFGINWNIFTDKNGGNHIEFIIHNLCVLEIKI